MSSYHSPPLRWGIIGCGDVTERKSGPAYSSTPGFELAAVMRRDLAKARDYAARHGVPWATDRAGDLLESDQIDAIYVATPPDSHMEYGLRAAAAGKICCIEKPFAPTFAEADKVTRAFAAKGIPLFLAYYRRTLPRFLKVKSLLEQGRIGKIRHLQWTYCALHNSQSGYSWRTDAAIAPGGLFDDLASHGLDLFGFLLGDYAQAHGVSTNQMGQYSAKDAVAACWMHQSGVTGMGTWNFGSAVYTDHVEIHGEAGKITFSVFADQPVVLRSEPGGIESFSIAHPDPIQLLHVQAMADHLFRGIPHPSTGETGLHTAWVMDQILGSVSKN